MLLLTLVPLVWGLILIVAAFAEITIWTSETGQITLGILYVLGSFTASNALQKRWLLAAGWLLTGVGLWLIVSRPESLWLAGVILGAVGILLLSGEFLKRWWEREDRARKQ